MARKVKEQPKKSANIDLDNEIIIGIKTLPKVEPKKRKNVKSKKRNTKKTRRPQKEKLELKLGIEDETIKSKTKKTTKKQEIAKKKRRSIVRFIKWTSLIIIFMGGTVYFLLSPFFNIKNIKIQGNQKLTTEELTSLSQVQLNENMFKMVKSKVKKNIKQNAYVENVKIKRELPDTITIQVEERTPTYIISFANAYVYINNQGYFLEISKNKLELPIITGYLTQESEIYEGSRLCLEDLQRLESILQIMKSAESNDIAKLVTKINIADKQNYILELKEEKKIVHMGDTANLSTKMLYIKSIIEQNKKIEGEILVNTDLNSKGAIFRKKV